MENLYELVSRNSKNVQFARFTPFPSNRLYLDFLGSLFESPVYRM